MQTVKSLEFSTDSREGVVTISGYDMYRARHLHGLIAGQDMDFHNKVADIKLVRSVLSIGLRDSLIFVEDAYKTARV